MTLVRLDEAAAVELGHAVEHDPCNPWVHYFHAGGAAPASYRMKNENSVRLLNVIYDEA